MRKISSSILKFLGWKIVGKTDYPDKCILCVAPHTSNWDLVIGQLVYAALGKRAYFLIKKTWFFFPLNIFFDAIGGIAVDRSKKNSLTEVMAEKFASRDVFQLAVTPEGTRKRNPDWKKGFYYIALEAKVPIIIITLDYSEKIVIFKEIFYPTGNVDEDMSKIKSYYVGVLGKNPKNFAT